MAKKDKRIKYTSDTEKPVMVSVRLPRELYDKLERYATEHQQSISELLKDGAVMRLETEVDPRYRRAESTTEGMELQIDGASILRDMQATLARHETQMHALMQAIERQTTPTGNGSDGVSYPVIHGNTTEASYNTNKHHLGKLCPRGHDHDGTGQSLRNTDNQCLRCNAERKAAKDAKKRQAKATTT